MDGKRRTVDLDESSFRKSTATKAESTANASGRNDQVDAQIVSRHEDEL
jgi:hypothetical protein